MPAFAVNLENLFPDGYFANSTYTTDGVHPGLAGSQLMSTPMSTWLQSPSRCADALPARRPLVLHAAERHCRLTLPWSPVLNFALECGSVLRDACTYRR